MSTATTATFTREKSAANRPIWRELFAGLDLLALKTSPVYYGFGVPRGDKSAVILVPGFMGTDHYLYEMNFWLRRIGYNPYMSKIGWNAECLNILTERLAETVAKAAHETGQKVHLIGHSLGGILSRSVIANKPENVASVITLGSPFRGIRSHPLVIAMANRVREKIMCNQELKEKQPDCYTGFCSCEAVCGLQKSFPAEVKNTAIYTKTDGIVDWQVCVNEDPTTNFEVVATHVGLAFNPNVYSLIAKRLAETIS